MYTIRKILTSEEIEICVDMAISQLIKSSAMPYDRITCIKNLYTAVRTDKPVRLIEKDSKIIGWILGEVSSFYHADYPVLVQKYFSCNVKGRDAINAIIELHKFLESYAYSKKIPLVHSMGSYYDRNNTFVRILETAKWERIGYLAVKHTGHPFRPPERSPVGRFRGSPDVGHGVDLRVPQCA
jgi:hypothetical protein